MDEIVGKPDSFSDEPDETADQFNAASEPPSERLDVASNNKMANSETLEVVSNDKIAKTVTVGDSKEKESCTVVLPELNKQREGSFMSYLIAHPLLLLLAVVCLVAVVYLILDFLRGFFPWMQN